MIQRLMLILSLLLVSAACTSGRRGDPPPMPEFETVAVLSVGISSDLKARFGVAPEDEIAMTSSGAGMGAGAAAGAGVALVCGPLFWL